MFEKFGEFDSAEEINRAAAAQKAEGDEEALILLAMENGIDREDAEDYMDDCVDQLCNMSMAAIGKLKVEIEHLKLEKVLKDWAEELQAWCIDSEKLAAGVRRKGKSLAQYIALLASDGFKNKAVVSKEIVALCDKEIKNIVGNHEFAIGIPDKKSRRRIAENYYGGIS